MPFYGGNLTEWSIAFFEEELERHVSEDSLEDLYTFVKNLDDESDFAEYVAEVLRDVYSIPEVLRKAMTNSIEWDVVRNEFRNYCDHDDRVVEARTQEEEEQTSG